MSKPLMVVKKSSEEETLREARIKRQTILIWETLDNAIINNLLLTDA